MSVDAPLVSAIVVSATRASALSECLDSLLAQTEPRLQVVVVLNGAIPEVCSAAAARAEADDRLTTLPVSRTSASEARNLGLAEARAKLLYFVDDDVVVPEGSIRAVIDLFDAHPEVCMAGGPNLTPPDDPEFAQLAGALLGHPFGTGITYHRYCAAPEHSATERDLTLCNLAARRSVFERGFRFPGRWGGEENTLMGRVSHAGGRLWYSPTLRVLHRRRSTVRGYATQIVRYGFGRGIAIHSAPKTFHPAFFAPVGLLGYLALSPALLCVSSWALLPGVAYAAASVAASATIAVRHRRPSYASRLPPLFLVTHLAYAAGLLKGLARGRQCRPRRSVAAVQRTRKP